MSENPTCQSQPCAAVNNKLGLIWEAVDKKVPVSWALVVLVPLVSLCFSGIVTLGVWHFTTEVELAQSTAKLDAELSGIRSAVLTQNDLLAKFLAIQAKDERAAK